MRAMSLVIDLVDATKSKRTELTSPKDNQMEITRVAYRGTDNDEETNVIFEKGHWYKEHGHFEFSSNGPVEDFYKKGANYNWYAKIHPYELAMILQDVAKAASSPTVAKAFAHVLPSLLELAAASAKHVEPIDTEND